MIPEWSPVSRTVFNGVEYVAPHRYVFLCVKIVGVTPQGRDVSLATEGGWSIRLPHWIFEEIKAPLVGNYLLTYALQPSFAMKLRPDWQSRMEALESKHKYSEIDIAKALAYVDKSWSIDHYMCLIGVAQETGDVLWQADPGVIVNQCFEEIE